MTDITKCNGVNCPVKDTCYRYIVPAKENRQSYSSFDIAYIDKNLTCEYYWPTENSTKTINGNFRLLEK